MMGTFSSGSYLGAFSAFMTEWTPTVLFWNYILFSFFAYVAMPDLAHGIFWYILAIIQTLVSLTVVVEALQSIKPAVQSRRALRKSAREPDYPAINLSKAPHIDVVLVAYLPNEKDIILDQARYAARELNYPKSKYTVNVVYNTPEPIEPIETQLRQLEDEYPHVRVISVPGSTSKADNINYFLTCSTKGSIISVLDTDHFLEPHALRWIAHRFMNEEIDIIQGRCCIYNTKETWVTRFLGAEFDMIYGVFHPGRATLHGYGLFGGSNGHWSASLLRTLQFNGAMLTEDIDSSVRAIISGARIAYDLRIVSYEQAPTTVQGFWKQRMRWAQGWFQVSTKHTWRAMQTGAVGSRWRSRAGLFSLLAFREAYFHLVTQLFCVILSSFLASPPHNWAQLYRFFVGFKISVWMLIFNLFCIVLCTWITLRNRSAFVTVSHVIAFGCFSPFYYTIISCMAILSHFRQFAGYSRWNVTARKAKT